MIKINNNYSKTVFKVFLFLLLTILFALKNFSFPVHESIFFLHDSGDFNSVITNYWHTPTYLLLIYFFRLIFNNPIFSLQMVGLLSVFLTAIILFKLIETIEVKNGLDKTLKYVLAIMTVTYVPVYNSIFLFEIDSTVIMPFLLYFSIYLSRNIGDVKETNVILFLLLGFWLKEVIYPVLLLFVVLLYLKNYKIKVALIKIFKISVATLLLVIITYGIFSFSVRGDWGAIGNNAKKLFNFNNYYSDVTSYSSQFYKFASFLLWGNVILFLNIVFGIKRLIQNSENQNILIFIIIYLISFTFLWPSVSGGWPKYSIPLFPILLYLNVYLLNTYTKRTVYSILFVTTIYLFFGDYIYNIYTYFQGENDFIVLVNYFSLYIIAPLILTIIIKRFSKISIYEILFGLFIAQNSSLLIHQINADYSTNYNYGVKGTRQVIEYITNNDIGTQTEFPIYDMLFREEKKEKLLYYINRNHFFSDERKKTQSEKKKIQFIFENYKYHKQVGSYQIWRFIE